MAQVYCMRSRVVGVTGTFGTWEERVRISLNGNLPVKFLLHFISIELDQFQEKYSNQEKELLKANKVQFI